jgi:hypothetical protein
MTPFVYRSHQLEVGGLVCRAPSWAHRNVHSRSVPGHFGLTTTLEDEPGLVDERGVRALESGACVQAKEVASDVGDVVGFVGGAQEAGDRGVPRQHGEGVQVWDGGQFGGFHTAAEKAAGAVAVQISHGGAVELHAPLQIAAKVLGGNDFGDGATGQCHNLVVDELDAAFIDGLLGVGNAGVAGVDVTVLVERCGGHGSS